MREMRNFRVGAVLCSLIFGGLLTGCGDKNYPPPFQEDEVIVSTTPELRLLSQTERDSLSHEDVIRDLQSGNERFLNKDLAERNHQDRVSFTATAEYPKAVILSCMDSRVPVEQIFDQGIGDVLVVRIAGNFADKEILASLEFATEVAGSKVVVVLGHENCGVVKAAIDGVESGNLLVLIKHLKPAIHLTSDYPREERTSQNPAYVQDVIRNNVRYTVEHIRENSATLGGMEKNGEIKIVGAYYSLSEGTVMFNR